MSVPAGRRMGDLAGPAAAAILDGFERYRKRFTEVTRRAGERFDTRDWKGALNDATDRLDLYGAVVQEVENEVRRLLWTRLRETAIWADVKGTYSSLIAGRPDWEIAETFLNSVTRRIFATAGVEPDIEFIDSEFDPPAVETPESLCRQYAGTDLGVVIEAILADAWFDAPWEDRARDVRLAAESLRRQLAELGATEETLRGAEVMAAPFFRRKGAYLVGRLTAEAGYRPL